MYIRNEEDFSAINEISIVWNGFRNMDVLREQLKEPAILQPGIKEK